MKLTPDHMFALAPFVGGVAYLLVIVLGVCSFRMVAGCRQERARVEARP